MCDTGGSARLLEHTNCLAWLGATSCALRNSKVYKDWFSALIAIRCGEKTGIQRVWFVARSQYLLFLTLLQKQLCWYPLALQLAPTACLLRNPSAQTAALLLSPLLSFGTVVCTEPPLASFFPPPTEPSCLLHCADVQKRKGTFAFMQSFTECAERCNLFLGELFSFACPRAFLHLVLSVH